MSTILPAPYDLQRRGVLRLTAFATAALTTPALAAQAASPALPPLQQIDAEVPSIGYVEVRPVTIPAVTVEGDRHGAPHPAPAAYRAKFTGPYEHRLISGGIGHNLPQEAPAVFAQAMLNVGRGA